MSAGAPLAEIDDVEAVWRPLSSDERGQAERLLELASALVRSRVGSVDARLAAGTPSGFSDVVAAVVASAVVRVLVNPDGVSQRAEGPFSSTFSSGTGRLYLTPEEVDLLRPTTSGGAGGGVYSVSLA